MQTPDGGEAVSAASQATQPFGASGDAAQGSVRNRMRASGPSTLLALFAASICLAVAILSASYLGPDLRQTALITTATGPAGSEVSFDDVSDGSAVFFGLRDSVEVRVPWSMSVREFLRLYNLNLEGNQSIRDALMDRLGSVDPDEFLAEGTTLTFTLSPRRSEP